MAKNSGLGAGIATIAIGAAIGFGVNEYMESNRYPILSEFYLVEKCAESSRDSLTLKQYGNKVEICACALENTQKEYKHKDISSKEKQNSFVKKFKEEADKCLDQPH
ncbi:MAG: hypothetical protein LBB59_02155 [Campylobacteraceae bacterium]|jgi:hypothetical protein|nr:hypothetical protein [Campylobacteraceae bacterium]